MTIKFPIEVKDITFEENQETIKDKNWLGDKCGQMVSVRPCGGQYKNKTFLGILIGDVALSVGASFDEKTGKLKLYKSFYNPAIFVPDLNEIIYGCGSWWGKIDSEEQLREITDNDIDNVWYVKALKALQAKDGDDHGQEKRKA